MILNLQFSNYSSSASHPLSQLISSVSEGMSDKSSGEKKLSPSQKLVQTSSSVNNSYLIGSFVFYLKIVS